MQIKKTKINSIPTVAKIVATKATPTGAKISTAKVTPTVAKIVTAKSFPRVAKITAAKATPTVAKISAAKATPTIAKIPAAKSLPRVAKILLPKLASIEIKNLNKKKSNSTLLFKLNLNSYFKLNIKTNNLLTNTRTDTKNICLNYYLNIYLYNLKKIKRKLYTCISVIRALSLSNLNLIELNYSILLNKNINYLRIKNQTLSCVYKNLLLPTLKLNNFDLILSFYNHHQTLFIIKSIETLKNNRYFNYNLIIQKNIFMFHFNFIKLYNTNNIELNKNKFYLLKLYSYKFLISFIFSRKINSITPKLLNFFLLKTKKNTINLLKNLLWKNTNKTKFNPISSSYLYYLNRLNDKIDYLDNNTTNKNLQAIDKLKNIRNLFYSFLDTKEKALKSKYGIFRNKNKTRDFKSLKWRANIILFLKKNKINKNIKFKIERKRKSNSKLNFAPKLKSRKRYWRKASRFSSDLKIKKLVSNNATFNYKYNQELISLIFGFKINIYFINALSFTRFDFHLKQEEKRKLLRKKRSSLIFINQLEREFIQRYKFVANYLQDFARIGFISLYTKDLSFLVKFIAFQISHLQKNRKETKLIRFIIKAIKIFSAQRQEVLGLKVEFKGRVNRWRRTKIIKGKRGVIPYNSYATRLEYATATAVTRKGALGIRLWVYYNLNVDTGYERYIKVNKILKYKQIKTKFIN